MRNRRPDLNGILPVNKPIGWTSADVCRWVRARTEGAKVGHAGTLDPLATGVLVLCLGRATKLIEQLMDGRKGYRATVDLAHRSTTDDAEGELSAVAVDAPPSDGQIQQACAKFVGAIQQTPPQHSAVHVEGRRAYQLARQGQTVDIKPRPIEIYSITVLGYRWPLLELDIHCGRGTYIRSLARDLGSELDTGGMLTALVRTQVGRYTLADAISIEDLQTGDAITARLVPVESQGQ